MPLDVTPGGTAADSYLSVADSLLYANNDLGSFAAGWIAADSATQEKALRRATRDIDRFLGATVAGYAIGQRLSFPRYYDVDPITGLPIIPERVQEATYLQAIYVLANADVIDQASTRRARGLMNFTEPNVSGAIAEDANFGRLSPDAAALLTGEGFEGGAIVGWISST